MTWLIILTLFSFSLWDICTRRIPRRVLVGHVACILLWSFMIEPEYPLSWFGAIAGFAITAWVGLPGGDRWGMAMVGFMLGFEVLGWTIFLCFGIGALILLWRGKRFAYFTQPLFPYIALAAACSWGLLGFRLH